MNTLALRMVWGSQLLLVIAIQMQTMSESTDVQNRLETESESESESGSSRFQTPLSPLVPVPCLDQNKDSTDLQPQVYVQVVGLFTESSEGRFSLQRLLFRLRLLSTFSYVLDSIWKSFPLPFHNPYLLHTKNGIYWSNPYGGSPGLLPSTCTSYTPIQRNP